MAILFYIPRQLWRGLSLRSGVDLKDLIEAAQTYRSANVPHDDKIKLLEYLTNWVNGYCSHSYRVLTLEKRKARLSRKAKLTRMIHHLLFPIGIYTGNYLIISYLFIKLLYLLNSIGQILLLNVLLGRDFWAYGIDIIHRYWTKQIGILYTGNEYFPKVVLCDFTVREPNHPRESHLYTVQCVLPFNLFNQQIFTYLYFWLIILAIFNCSSILMWLYRISPYNNFHYLERRLIVQFLTEARTTEQDLRHIFVYRYLQGDGTFMLRLVASNVNDYVCTKIVLELYRKFRLAILNDRIGRESVFKPISKEKQFEDENDFDDEDGSTDQTGTDIPPIPNPRHGKIFIEHSSSETSFIEQQSTSQARRAVSFSLPTTVDNRQIHLRDSPVSFYKDIHHAINIQKESSDQLDIPLRKTTEYPFDEKITPLSSLPTSPSFPPSTMGKFLSPYATTYLTTDQRNEQDESSYLDDDLSNSSISGRFASNTEFQLSQRPTITSISTNLSVQRTHDV